MEDDEEVQQEWYEYVLEVLREGVSDETRCEEKLLHGILLGIDEGEVICGDLAYMEIALKIARHGGDHTQLMLLTTCAMNGLFSKDSDLRPSHIREASDSKYSSRIK